MSPGRDGPSSSAILVERDTQSLQLRHAIEAARRGGGQTLLISGEAGIGKTALLRSTIDEAAKAGSLVLQAHARELEQQYPYGVVLQLLERTVAQHGDDGLLAGAASLAARLFSPEAQPSETDATGEPFPILHGLYWLVANLAERQPLLIAIDDAHWADLASLRFVHYLAQRLEDLPVCLLLTARPEWSWPGELRQVAEMPATQQVRLPGLSLEAVEQLMAADGLPATDALAQSVWQATRGNPFFIRQVLRQMASDEARATSVVAPETLTRWVLARIERAGPAARRVAEALAVLGGSARLRTIAELAGVKHADATDATGRLADRGIVQVNGEISFVHPIVQTAVHESIDPIHRGELHRIAARSVAADPAELDAAAVHLLSVPPMSESWVIDLLEAAAQRAMERAAPETAAEYLRRAVEEPPEPARRPDVLIDLARSEAATGNGAAAVDHLTRALELSSDARQRASVLYQLGQARVVSGQWEPAVRDFERGIGELERAPDEDPNLHAELHAGRIASRVMNLHIAESIGQELAALLAQPVLPPFARQLATSVGFAASAQGSAPAGDQVALVRRALAGATMAELLASGQTVELAAGVLLAADELEADCAVRAWWKAGGGGSSCCANRSRRSRSRPRASSASARCSPLAPRCVAQASSPRRGSGCVARSTRRTRPARG